MGNIKKTTIGGQALIEGILMRGPEKTAIAVRKPDGEIELTFDNTKTLISKGGIYKLPFIRGVVALIDSIKLGSNALMYSASFYEDGDKEEEKSSFLEKIFGDKAEKVAGTLTMLISLLVSLGLFFFLPTLVTNFFRQSIKSTILLNLIEGLIRILIFLIYIISVSNLKEMKRVFEYHGAEHKTIFCYEKGLDLTVENVRKQSRLHPRCGTSFLFSVMIISILVLSFFGWPNPFMRLVTRLVCLPIIMGISYEFNRILGRSDSTISKIFAYPGLFIQKIATVKEPHDDQIDVAITALKAVIPDNPEKDIW